MDETEAVIRALKTPIDDQDALKLLMPLIVPASYFEIGFPAPHEPLPDPEFVLTAVILRENQAMVYLNKSLSEQWAVQGIQWKQKAMENLLAADGGRPVTHIKAREEGGLQWAAMMTPDGLGTSRVLCTQALRELFPEGYWIAIPERSMGVAISKSLEGEGLEEAVGLVRTCYAQGTTPNSPRLFEPEALGA